MKFVQIVLSLTLLLGISYCFPTGAPNAKEQVKLAHICIHSPNGTNDAKPPVLLLHGVLAFKEMWLGMMPILAMKTGRRICAADLRNHGDSPWSNDSDTSVMASDLNLLMKTLNTEKIALLGHSLGGKIAVDFTLTNPEKVERLIVEDMRPNGLSDEARKVMVGAVDPYKDALGVIPKGVTEKEAKFIVFKFVKFMLELVNEKIDIDERIVDHVPIKCSNGKCRWKANVDLLDIAKKDLDKYMPESRGKFEKPALFIYGGKSPFKVGDVKDDILKLFPKTKFFKVEKANHLVSIHPEYKDAVINFLNAEN
ncbi:sn-1-specific diacylglycerol lipase ABHD11 isoform X2 [Parasteatoda tepidariorum]|nr:protein ABHD11 [Parasteatoda tepidariorum]